MRYLFYLCILCLVVSCKNSGDHGHEHDDGEHSHAEEDLSISYTRWTENTELFVEFPVLVVGQVSRFAAHFTRLDGHKPITQGKVTVSLIKGNKGVRQTVEEPSSPGIFTPSLQPKEAGIYRLVFDLQTPDYSDQIVISDVPVFSSKDEAINTVIPQGEDGVISFLKEQAWKMDFQTAPVVKKEIYDVISTSGSWKVSPSDVRTLIAPASGSVLFLKNNLIEGVKVKKGDPLMVIESEGLTSNNLQTEIKKAKAVLDQAEAEYKRKSELNKSKVVPSSQLEKAREQFIRAKTEYEALTKGYSRNGKQVVAPINGYIKSLSVANGEFTEQGRTLVSITNHKTALLEAQVSPSLAGRLINIHNIWYQTSKNKWSDLRQNGGKVISVGKEVERDKPLLSVYAQINEEIEMPEGSFTEVQIAVGEPKPASVIPTSALLEDYGDYSVIVQLSGESFERRNVQLGNRNGNEVEITKGLQPGEVVVSQGAYRVKMASMSGQAPAHGHAH